MANSKLETEIINELQFNSSNNLHYLQSFHIFTLCLHYLEQKKMKFNIQKLYLSLQDISLLEYILKYINPDPAKTLERLAFVTSIEPDVQSDQALNCCPTNFKFSS